MRRFPPLTPEYIKSRLRVNLISGRAFWIDPTKHHLPLIGKEAGFPRPSRGKQYWIIKLNSIPYRRSQIILTIKSGMWPLHQVDHKNGDSLDDRASNLRHATATQNSWNHKRHAKKSTLPMGIRLLGKKYQARIAKNKKTHHLGVYSNLSEAITVYNKARKNLFGEWA